MNGCGSVIYKLAIYIAITSQQPFNTFYLQIFIKILLLKGSVSRCHVSFFQVQDICKIHIDDVLKDISETVLIELPEDHASSVEHLIEHNEVYTLYSIDYRLFFFFK